MPYWPRLWIICGTPSRGPWAECSAMNSAPTRLPSSTARMLAPNDSPNATGASAPVTNVSGMMLELNQIVNRSRGRPCRSDSGIAAIVYCSMVPAADWDVSLMGYSIPRMAGV